MSEQYKAKILKVTVYQEGMRLDRVLRDAYEAANFGAIQKLCRKGEIRLDGKRVKGNERVEDGQEIRIPPSLQKPVVEDAREKAARSFHLTTQDKRDLEEAIIYEDDDLVVLNKPYGLPVQAGSGHSKSLDRMLMSYADGDYQPKLVHRIDKTTTGCLVLAKTKEMARTLSDQFKFRKARKTYWAIVEGKVMQHEGVIKTSIDVEGEEGEEKMAPNKRGQTASTEYKIIDSAGMYHWVEVYPKTGRKHQIRVHLASIGLPIVGDVKYGGKRISGDEDIPHGKLFLHAREVAFNLGKNKDVQFKADLPVHFKTVFKLMQWKAK